MCKAVYSAISYFGFSASQRSMLFVLLKFMNINWFKTLVSQFTSNSLSALARDPTSSFSENTIEVCFFPSFSAWCFCVQKETNRTSFVSIAKHITQTLENGFARFLLKFSLEWVTQKQNNLLYSKVKLTFRLLASSSVLKCLRFPANSDMFAPCSSHCENRMRQ